MSKDLVIYAAGSLKRAFSELLDQFACTTGLSVQAEFGPAGLLRERLENGARADVFASADSASPARLVSQGKALDLQVFAANALCAVLRPDSDVTEATLLEAMLDPALRLGTSTPVLDPSGDYALQVFRNVEALHPGAGKTLQDKAVAMVGGRTPTPIPAGWVASEYLVSCGATDIFLSYASYRDAILAAGRTRVVALPASLQIRADYALVNLDINNDGAGRLCEFIMGIQAQAILKRHGFLAPGSV